MWIRLHCLIKMISHCDLRDSILFFSYLVSLCSAIGSNHRDVFKLQEVAGAALAGVQMKLLNRHFHHLLRRSIQHPAARGEWRVGIGVIWGCDGLR